MCFSSFCVSNFLARCSFASWMHTRGGGKSHGGLQNKQELQLKDYRLTAIATKCSSSCNRLISFACLNSPGNVETQMRVACRVVRTYVLTSRSLFVFCRDIVFWERSWNEIPGAHTQLKSCHTIHTMVTLLCEFALLFDFIDFTWVKNSFKPI
jgi:hypothetical protein